MARFVTVKARTTTKGGDPSFADIIKHARLIGEQYVAVGILEPQRRYPDSDATLGQVALWQEFGTHTAKGKPMIPPRSFLRTPVDVGRAGIEELKARLLQRIFDGKLSPATALASIGADVVRRMQNTIKKRIAPKLAPYTLEKRKEAGISGTIPLLATQFLYNSIHFAVRRYGFTELRQDLRNKDGA